jgi:transcriptional regulator with XRE-family HTH domain
VLNGILVASNLFQNTHRNIPFVHLHPFAALEYGQRMRIREIRKSRGLTQAQLAELLDVEQGEISKLERNDRNPRLSTLQRVAEALSVEISDLFQDRSEEERVLIETFRGLNPDRRQGWLDMARMVRDEQES